MWRTLTLTIPNLLGNWNWKFEVPGRPPCEFFYGTRAVRAILTKQVLIKLMGQHHTGLRRKCQGQNVTILMQSPLGRVYTDRRKFRSQTSNKFPTIWADGKSRGGKSQRRKGKKREYQRREKVRRKKMQVREKVGKSRLCIFPMICGPRGWKSRLAKAAGAEPSGQMRNANLHAVVARSTFASAKANSTSR